MLKKSKSKKGWLLQRRGTKNGIKNTAAAEAQDNIQLV